MESNDAASTTLISRTTLVTGAGRGIGRAIALAFAEAGYNVACLSRTKHEVDAVVALINSTTTSKALSLVGDISDITNSQRIVQDVLSWSSGSIDVLVNCAGIARISALEFEKDMTMWQKVMDTNFIGPVAMTRILLPGMLAQGRGTIISIGSRNAAEDIPFMSAYSCSKTALLKFHHCLEQELRGRGITNFYVQPGNIDTGILNGPDTIDLASLEGSPGVRQCLEGIATATNTALEDVTSLCVLLATGDNFKVLSGLYVNAETDIEQLLRAVREGGRDKLDSTGLYSLKVEEFPRFD